MNTVSYSLKDLLEALIEEALDDYPNIECAGIHEEDDQVAFKLGHKQLQEISEWSALMSLSDLEGNCLLLEIVRLIEECQWNERPGKPTSASELDFLQPDADQLASVIMTITAESTYELLRLVLASLDGDIKFIQVSSKPALSSAIGTAMNEGFLALGLLGYQKTSEGTVQARKLLFKWHTDARLKVLFDRICQAGVDKSKWPTDRPMDKDE